MENSVIDVRPKLFQDVEHAIQSDLRYPLLPCLCPGALSRRIVRVRNASSRTIAHNLSKVKSSTARIRPRD
jgi:hypothetical protein